MISTNLRRLLSFAIAVFVCLTPALASAFDFSAHGYYRVRFEYTHDLDLQRPNDGIVPNDPENDSNDRFGTIAFGQQRFRVEPTLKLNDHISLHSQVDFLDNILFGQGDIASLEIANPIVGTLTLPAANGPFGTLGTVGGSALGSGGGNINVRQMYVDILTSAGKFRIGRQPSQFGLGIFVNDGNTMEGDFGDNFDRVLYLAGLDFKGGSRINFGLAYDFAFENTRDPSFSGLDTGVGSNWNDAMQGGLILLYQSDNFEVGSFSGLRFRNGVDGQPTTTAVYIDVNDEDGDLNTTEGIVKPAGKDGDTLIFTQDIYGKFHFLRDYTLSFEAVFIGGKMAPGVAVDAVVLDAPGQVNNPQSDPIELPQFGTQNDVMIFMAAAELDAHWRFGGEAHVQGGFASGDSSPLSSRITQLGFRPDYDIALMMFDVPLGTSPAVRFGGITELGRKPITPNYVTNAVYLTVGYKHKFDITSGVPWADDFKVGGKIISAWAPSRTIDINLSEVTGIAGLPHLVNNNRWYGAEIDLSVEATFFEVMHWKTVLGFLLPGGAYDIHRTSEVPGTFNGILFDNSNPAFAAKTTLFFEF